MTPPRRIRLYPGEPTLQVVDETMTSYLVENYSGCTIWVRKDMVEVVDS